MIAMPDPDTYVVLPWRDDGGQGMGNVARMFCDVLKPGGEPYEGDPRFVMRRAIARALAAERPRGDPHRERRGFRSPAAWLHAGI